MEEILKEIEPMVQKFEERLNKNQAIKAEYEKEEANIEDAITKYAEEFKEDNANNPAYMDRKEKMQQEIKQAKEKNERNKKGLEFAENTIKQDFEKYKSTLLAKIQESREKLKKQYELSKEYLKSKKEQKLLEIQKLKQELLNKQVTIKTFNPEYINSQINKIEEDITMIDSANEQVKNIDFEKEFFNLDNLEKILKNPYPIATIIKELKETYGKREENLKDNIQEESKIDKNEQEENEIYENEIYENEQEENEIYENAIPYKAMSEKEKEYLTKSITDLQIENQESYNNVFLEMERVVDNFFGKNKLYIKQECDKCKTQEELNEKIKNLVDLFRVDDKELSFDAKSLLNRSIMKEYYKKFDEKVEEKQSYVKKIKDKVFSIFNPVKRFFLKTKESIQRKIRFRNSEVKYLNSSEQPIKGDANGVKTYEDATLEDYVKGSKILKEYTIETLEEEQERSRKISKIKREKEAKKDKFGYRTEKTDEEKKQDEKYLEDKLKEIRKDINIDIEI